MDEQTKEEYKSFLLVHWREVIIIILIVGCIFTYWRWNEVSKDLDAAKRAKEVQTIITEINKGTEAITKRDSELYPQLNADIQNLNNSIRYLSDGVKRLETNQPKKEQSYEIFKKQSVNEISQYFTNLGYVNTVGTSK
jgi:uncharacterized protein YoxC